MATRLSKKAVSTAKRLDDSAGLRKALSNQGKAELVNTLLELAESDRKVLRHLTTQFHVAPAPDDLEAATRQAIADATDFDEREINQNFDYNFEAYDVVKRNLGRLIALGQLRLAMQLALVLMKDGSYQVEMSDEGLMTDDIEDCLSVVLKALKKCDLPPEELFAWSTSMLEFDRIGFIAEEPLLALQTRSRPRSGKRKKEILTEK
jgi:hypothetical protein